MPDVQYLSAVADTEATSLSGERKSNWSDWDQVTAPEGFAINKDKIKREAVSERGSENRDEVVFSDYVEILPGTGVELPRTVKVRAFARSSRGHGGGGGHTHYKYEVPFVKIQG